MTEIRWLNRAGCTEEMLEEYRKEIPADRLKQLESVHAEKGYLESLTGEWLVRRMLSERTGIPAIRLEIVRRQGKKPYLSDSSCFFNISHSGDYVVAAVSDVPVGIDLEQIGREASKALKRISSPSDWQYIMEGENPLVRMMEIWTRKEALVKCLGTGICDPRLKETVGYGDVVLWLDEGQYRIRNVDGPKGYVCAVCEKVSDPA